MSIELRAKRVDKIRSYRDLEIWKKGIELVKAVYSMTNKFPKEETYNLVSQMRRSAVSLPSNIAEGFRRFHNKEYKQFLYIALGSCAELETQMTIAKELGYVLSDGEENFLKKTDIFCRMTMSLIKKL